MLKLEQGEWEGEEAREMSRGWASLGITRSRFNSKIMGIIGEF